MDEVLYGFGESEVRRLAAMLRAYESGQFFPPSAGIEEPGDSRDFNRIPFVNAAGAEAPAFGLLRVTGMTAAGNRRIFTVAKPDGTFGLHLVNSRKAIANNRRGWGTWLWHADEVLYRDSHTPLFGQIWGPKKNQWELEENFYGFLIQGGNKLSPKRTRAIQYFVDQVIGKTGSPITKNTGGTIRVWAGTGGTAVDTQVDIAVWNRSASIPGGKWVAAALLHGTWFVSPLECA